MCETEQRQREITLTRTIVFVGLVMVASQVAGHHSRAHYGDSTQEIRGELLSVSWTNPHAGFTLGVRDDTGETEMWRLESWTSPYILSRMGVAEGDFVVGQSVRVAGRVSSSRPNDLLLTHLLRPDGTEVLLAPQVAPFFASTQLGGIDQWLDDEIQLTTTSSEDRGIFRVWSVDYIYSSRTHSLFTSEAIEARAGWDELDSFIVTCEPRGMPLIMNNPFPFEFIDHGDQITLRGQYYDFSRTIHMDGRAIPADQPASLLGDSIGRWEENTLVVDTTNISWRYFDFIGTELSEDMRVTERFTLSEDQGSLHYQRTIIDPATFLEPATREQTWLALGESVEPFECVPG